MLGNYKDENAILFGAILPTHVAKAPEYLSSLQETGASIKNGLALAVDDFAASPSKGLPPAAGRTEARPLAFVVCSDNASATSTAAATTHLAVNLGVPAIVGTAFSTYTRTIAATLATLNKTDVLMMVPRSTNLALADNAGNFARLSPPDAVQGSAISALFANREPSIRNAIDAGVTTLKVALVYKEDAYGNAVAASVKSTLRFNGVDPAGNGAAFKELKYGNPDTVNYSPQFPSTTLGIVNARPHAVIIVGTNEVVPGIIATVEANWAENTYRPRYFLSDGVAVRELWDYLANNDAADSTRRRILGTIATGNTPRFNAFAGAYAAKYPQQHAIVYGAAGAYDAAYMLAYGVAAIGSKPVTGPNLLEGFTLLAPGGGALQVGVGPDDIVQAFSKLASGQAINLDGASSQLDFDPNTHAASSVTTQVWCIPSASGRAQQAILAGLSVSPANAVQGSLSAACGQ